MVKKMVKIEREETNLVVLNGEEHESLVIGLEDRLVLVASDGKVSNESVASISGEFVNLGLLYIDRGSLFGGSSEFVIEGSRLGEVEFVESGSSDF